LKSQLVISSLEKEKDENYGGRRTLPYVLGGIDLSVGSTYGCVGLTISFLLLGGMPVMPTIILGLALGALLMAIIIIAVVVDQLGSRYAKRVAAKA